MRYDVRGCIPNLNRAGVEELSKIPEIGESEQGPFGNIQHPGNVTGVGEELRKALRNRVRFELGDGVGKNPPS